MCDNADTPVELVDWLCQEVQPGIEKIKLNDMFAPHSSHTPQPATPPHSRASQAGPCAVHDPAAAMEYAARLLALARRHTNDLVVVMAVRT